MKLPILLLAGLLLFLSACSSASMTVHLVVYFTNVHRYSVGTEPFEEPVTRVVPVTGSLPEMTLEQLFLGPTAQEKAQGLDIVRSGTTGFSKLTVQDGIARLYLTGKCASGGATYTIGNLIFANLKQFPEIRSIKIYDENGQTETPAGQADSIPFCLEP